MAPLVGKAGSRVQAAPDTETLGVKAAASLAVVRDGTSFRPGRSSR